MSNLYQTKNGRASKRGALIDGIWHCDCEPRLPAEKFQTKNGGKNHGRWFYTCQKPQQKRCSFFLWADDAQIREESAVINNSRNEPSVPPTPQTPKRQTKLPQSPTSIRRANSVTLSPGTPKKQPQSIRILGDEDEEDYSWSSSNDEELASIAEAVTKMEKESPRKAARTPLFDSPGKRNHTKMSATSSDDTSLFSDDIFRTPTTSMGTYGLLSPNDSQARPTYHEPFLQSSSSLTSEILHVLKPANLSTQLERDLIELLSRHELRTQGIIKGRDITRLAVEAKDKKITELQARVTALEAEKETSRMVIAHLKQDMATSPRKITKSRSTSKSEISA